MSPALSYGSLGTNGDADDNNDDEVTNDDDDDDNNDDDDDDDDVCHDHDGNTCCLHARFIILLDTFIRVILTCPTLTSIYRSEG